MVRRFVRGGGGCQAFSLRSSMPAQDGFTFTKEPFMTTFSRTRFVAALGAASAAQARSDLYFSLGVQAPPVYVQPAPYYVQQSRPVYVAPAQVYVRPAEPVYQYGYGYGYGYGYQEQRARRHEEWRAWQWRQRHHHNEWEQHRSHDRDDD
jgi:hypothetical protein